MADSELIAGLGTRASWVRASPVAAQRDLSSDERSLVQSIGAGASIREVLARCGISEARAIAVLLGMRLKGLVQPMPAPTGCAAAPAATPAVAPSSSSGSQAVPRSAPAPRASPVAAWPLAPAAVDAAAFDEKVDLDEARKKEVLELESRLESDHFFGLLGVPPGSAAADCKKAYYELTKRFHPDRYFGKNLGSFKQRIEKIFRKLTEAQGVLSDSAKRQAYLAAHPELNAPAPKSVAAAVAPRAAAEPAIDPKLTAERAVERRARLARHPYLAKAGKLHELVSRGKENLGKGEFAKAYTDLSLAAQIDSKSKEIADLMAQAKRGGDKKRSEAEFKEATSAEAIGDSASALTHFKSAVTLDPDNAECAFRAAKVMANHGGEAELKEAHNLARRATELVPKNVEYHLLFARVLLRAGLDKNAQREYETVLKLHPDNEQAKEHLKKLKWKI
ncbi:MAG: DnaJ domain-containing protein [Deltaproteobacteria bacterium]|nr:DnaJ domain-containing protein [Deltaproteobacteria bacterium]